MLRCLYRLLRPLLFWQQPENAHHRILRLLRLVGAISPLRRLIGAALAVEDRRLAATVFGVKFPNPLGLAAGFDKDGMAVNGLWALGFGFLELGTVTPRPQSGNPRPRLLRLPEHEALWNRLGFPGEGLETMRANLLAARGRLSGWPRPVGLNLGKQATTPLAEATGDYLQGVQRLFDLADYFAVNVSSPNTEGLRSLQEERQLRELLAAVVGEVRALASERNADAPPVLVKLAPDLSEGQLEQAVTVACEVGIDGIIATNTTRQRFALPMPDYAMYQGGLSGHPLEALATRIVARIHRLSEGRVPIIGVGGISTPDDVWHKLLAGASLVQIYSAMVFQGPGLIRHLLQGLVRLMDQHGVEELSSIVGTQAERLSQA